MENKQIYDGLIQKIETVLLENRCSLSDGDIVLLQNCLIELYLLKANYNFGKDDVIARFGKIAKWLMLLFDLGDKFKDMF